MSFLKKIFGLGAASEGDRRAPAPEHATTHEGFDIRATPYEEQGKFQLCGVIAKEIDGVRKEHRFVRADRLSTMDDAVEMTFVKARQIIDQMGDRVFAD